MDSFSLSTLSFIKIFLSTNWYRNKRLASSMSLVFVLSLLSKFLIHSNKVFYLSNILFFLYSYTPQAKVKIPPSPKAQDIKEFIIEFESNCD